MWRRVISLTLLPMIGSCTIVGHVTISQWKAPLKDSEVRCERYITIIPAPVPVVPVDLLAKVRPADKTKTTEVLIDYIRDLRKYIDVDHQRQNDHYAEYIQKRSPGCE
jgi:hypothetical protein